MSDDEDEEFNFDYAEIEALITGIEPPDEKEKDDEDDEDEDDEYGEHEKTSSERKREKKKERVGENRKGRNVATRFEYYKLIEERTKQINRGAFSDRRVKMIDTSSMAIAENELNYRDPLWKDTDSVLPENSYRFPIEIVRNFPGNIFEVWKVEEVYLPGEIEKNII